MPKPFRRLVALVSSVATPVLVLAFLLFGLPAPAQAANVVVHTCTPQGLRAAISAAGPGSLITFSCTIGGPTIVLTQTQVLSRGVTLDGGGAITISGGNSIRIFAIPDPEKATLINLTLAHGHSGQGSALNVAGVAILNNVTFVHNTSTGNGGALAVVGLGTATVSASRFYSNSGFNGGAIDNAAGLGVDQSVFFGNTAFNGGAISQDAGAAQIVDSTFISNSAEFGGAIQAHGGSLTLAADELDHNAAPLPAPALGPVGGALYVAASARVLVRETNFYSNTAENGGAGLGGAVANEGSLIVLDTLFRQNHAQTDGGAIFNDSSLAITLSTFLRNSALGDGGGISNTGYLTLTTSTLVTNTAGLSGGALVNAKRAVVQSSLLFNNVAAGGGGALHNGAAGILYLYSSTVYSNTAATGAGGAVLNNGLMVAVNSTLAANAASLSGGALLNTGPNSPQAVLANATIVSNTAASGGAALRRDTGLLGLEKSLIAYNDPTNCQGPIVYMGHSLQFPSLSCGIGITDTDPLLGPLQDNGGPRVGVFGVGLPTLLPRTGSPAINAGTAANCPFPNVDERGFLRLGLCDLGAVERVFPMQLPLVRR